MREREIVHERPVADREVVIDERPVPARGGGGGVVAAIVGIVLVLLVGWFLLNALGVLGEAVEDGGGIPTDVEGNVEVEG